MKGEKDMKGEIHEQGKYTFYENNKGRTVLKLDPNGIYIWKKDNNRDSLFLSDISSSELEGAFKIIREGSYIVAELSDTNDEYSDLLRLFLEKEKSYEEIILSEELPTILDIEKSIIITGKHYDKDSIEQGDLVESTERKTNQNPITF